MIKDNAFLFEQIRLKKSFLCVGLDSDYEKIPNFIKEICGHDVAESIYLFNEFIFQATSSFAIAYKPNLAFYEVHGAKGMDALERTIAFIRKENPALYIIYDAKKGDIGNTGKKYAKAAFESYGADAITVNPLMGLDSIAPFTEHKGKRPIVLGLTSNGGADDFLKANLSCGDAVYEKIISDSVDKWPSDDLLMFVVGATKDPAELENVRMLIPEHFLLVPGIGLQGGNLGDVVKHAMNSKCGLIVNASRSIIFPTKPDIAPDEYLDAVSHAAKEVQKEMEEHLRAKNIIA